MLAVEFIGGLVIAGIFAVGVYRGVIAYTEYVNSRKAPTENPNESES